MTPVSRIADRCALLAPVAIALCGILLDIDLPGLYMDAVNPDYMVPRMLGSKAVTTIWVLPGNLFFGRFPLLSSLYHGAGQAWLGLPFFAVLGTDLVSIRMVHGIYALGLLATMLFILRRIGVWTWLTALTGTVIALDPSFIFAFRTQFCITTTPLIAFLGSLYLLNSPTNAKSTERSLFLSGLLYGISVYGYFIYLFFFPAVAVAVWLRIGTADHHRPAQPSVKLPALAMLSRWAKGFVIGVLPYLIGYLIVMQRAGGPAGFVDFLRNMQAALRITQASIESLGRFEALWTFYLGVSNHTSQSAYWIGSYLPLYGSTTKAVALLVLPVAFLVVAETRKTATQWSRLLVVAVAAFFSGAAVFGARLGSHHFLPVYLLLHLALAVTAYDALRAWSISSSQGSGRARHAVLASLLPGLLVIMGLQNLHGQFVSRGYLRETAGLGLYSDAINRFAADIRLNHATAYHVMPDWGLLMPAIFLTGGNVDIVSRVATERVRSLLCQGREVRWALVSGDRNERFTRITEELGGRQPSVEPWRQRDGRIVFEVATYSPPPDGAQRVCP